MNTELPRVQIAAPAADLVQKRYLWVYRNQVLKADDCEPGELVQVQDAAGRRLGTAHWSDRSKMALRLFTYGREPVDEAALVRERLEQARALREQIEPGRTARRLVYSEADGLAGVVVDQYADALVLQTLTQGAERLQPLLLELLEELLAPRAIVVRNDVKVRKLEGLEPERKVALGTGPFEVEVVQGRVRQVVDLWEGQKTGAFLDQQDNHLRVGRLARGRVLDLFTYSGGFALHAAAGAAERVVAVDSSRPALDWGRRSAESSGLGNVEWVAANVFDYLRDAAHAGERFDVVVVDPPAFAKRRSDLAAAQRAYRDLNRRALALLERDGLLVTCSCSYNLDEHEFVGLVRQAAESAGRTLVLLERRGQAADHPEALGLPESRYLKCLVLASRS